jgi:putative ABC transport system permease protein
VRFRDLVALAWFALMRHKVRTTLTTLGVLFGTWVLVVSLAVRQGVEETIVHEVSKHVELRRIEVNPPPGKPLEAKPIKGRMSEQRRDRLQKERVNRFGGPRRDPDPERRLTPERLHELAQIEHVNRVQPIVFQYGRALLGDRGEFAHFLAIPQEERDNLAERLIAGAMLVEDDSSGVLVTEFLLYTLGVEDEADMRRCIGRTLTFEVKTGGNPQPSVLLRLLTDSPGALGLGEEGLLGKVLKRLPEALEHMGLTPEEQKKVRRLLTRKSDKPVKSEEFRASYTIRGILGPPPADQPWRWRDWMHRNTDLFLSPQAASDFFLRLPHAREQGFGSAVIEVDDVENVKGVQQQIKDMGLVPHSAVDVIDRERFVPLVAITAMTVSALVCLLVAAIGIITTMLMSVLERVREIGIFKSIGAHEGHIQALFLMEGSLIGLVGGVCGLVLAWAISFPANSWLRSLVAQRLNVKLDSVLFAFPWWLIVGGPAFAVVVTTLAALYPARRAVRIDPVQALRHE